MKASAKKRQKCGLDWVHVLSFTVHYVSNCEQIASQFINSIVPLKDQVDSNTKQINELEKKLNAQELDTKKTLEEGVSQAKAEINKAIDLERENLERKIHEEVRKELRANSDPEPREPAQLKKEVQMKLDGEKDKAFRANNLIMAGVPEPDTDDLDVGKVADLEYIINMFTHMKVEP